MRAVTLPFAAALALILAGAALLGGGGEGDGSAAGPDVARIARRVEALRGLRFERRPVPQRVSAAQARREGLEDLDRSSSAVRRRVDEEVLKLLGLIEPSADLRTLSASVFGEGVAGYYDPRSERLRIVAGATPGALGEVVLAHELVHALEDQRFGLDLADAEDGDDDAALARLALVEGTATLVMQDYLTRYVGAARAFSGLLASSAGPDLPPFMTAQLLFPYTGGMTFAAALRARAGGRWTLVDLAERVRPPETTEQVLHPSKWEAVEGPLPVALRVGSALGAGWRRTGGGTWGEWATRELLGGGSGSGSSAASAAAGWGGDRYELWQRGRCAAATPCRGEDVLVLRWRWDTFRDAREFEAALRVSAVAGREGAAVARQGDAVTLALAPHAGVAARVTAG
jgi:hypothetical protein